MQTEYETRGKLGLATINKHPNGLREVSIHFWASNKNVVAESQRVDLEAIGCKTLRDAVDKACHRLGYLPLFEKLVIKGTHALVNCYRRPENHASGYATVIKKGIPHMKFSLSRINLKVMKSDTVEEALRKVAFETGAVCVSD